MGQPGVTLVDAEFNTCSQTVLGALASMADSAILQRLFFESHVMVAAHLRESGSNPDAGSTRRLPDVERQAKMMDLRTRIPAVMIEYQLEPSHALLDLVSQQWGSQQLEYMCHRRNVAPGAGK